MHLKTSLIVNDNSIPLNAFTQDYIGNILRGIAMSLGHDSCDVIIQIDEGGLRISDEKGAFPALNYFKKLLIESTVKGFLSPLKGIIWFQNITISVQGLRRPNTLTEVVSDTAD